MRVRLSLIISFLPFTFSVAQHSFISISKHSFIRNDQPYYFLGTNFWYGATLASTGKEGNRSRLVRELDHLQEMGINNLRILAGSEGPDNEPWRILPSLQPFPNKYNDEIFSGLDFLLSEIGKRDMVAVICLSNFWPWSGGMAQYIAWETGEPIPYPPPAEGGDWVTYQTYTARFYRSEKAMEQLNLFIQTILNRVNSITGKRYRNDPTIMAWQLANEPRGILWPAAYRRWVERTAAFIKSIDPNHLITIGSEGWTPSRLAGTHFMKDHRIPHIDYATCHIWVQNWGWYDPDNAERTYPNALKKAKKYLHKHLKQAQKLGMPVVLEEFGISRDKDDHDPSAPTQIRDRYYEDMFEEVYQQAKKGRIAGCNFWAWGGEGRPRVAKAIWKAGDEFIGDPPHEYQGWYSVYDKDVNTIEIIKTYAAYLSNL